MEVGASHQAFIFITVVGQQNALRAELTVPTHLPQLTGALSALIVTDNEPFFLDVSDNGRPTKALQGDNADLWQQWASAGLPLGRG